LAQTSHIEFIRGIFNQEGQNMTASSLAELASDTSFHGANASYLAALTAPVNRAILLERAVEDAKKQWKDEPEKVETSRGGLWRLLSATMAVLNHTHAELDRSKELLKEYEKRLTLLETIATTDELTGLKNRRGFIETFTQELDRVNRDLSKGGVLVLIDLDNFKTINDTYGHLAGDECLKLVTKTLQNTIRMMDTACRLGGDEFVLILANADKNKAIERIQTLAWELNHLTLEFEGHSISINASVGVKDYKGGDTANHVLGAADEALYAHKAARKG
jgi:diguanylate cyclase (GGDEF)-like protein